ncbi:uncharacterized protein LOC131801430 [Musca domestica]|uniref:Uncharacterized protein LOC131801430 n=1 Tax=Musca domestica TaxID=7370 RepID=A0ABM3URL9_MUSDO|nr:uncharacterized protein LOC131801430 [Musca domestica]
MSERERICFVVHDEVEIKPVLEYNKAEDVVDGFEDFGKDRRSKEMARRCLFFMIKGICSDWKFIISFYPVSKNTTKAVLHNVLRLHMAIKRIAAKLSISNMFVEYMNLNFKICPKLTEKHINPKLWDKMSVSRATEVLSNSVAAAMHACMQNGCILDDATDS